MTCHGRDPHAGSRQSKKSLQELGDYWGKQAENCRMSRLKGLWKDTYLKLSLSSTPVVMMRYHHVFASVPLLCCFLCLECCSPSFPWLITIKILSIPHRFLPGCSALLLDCELLFGGKDHVLFIFILSVSGTELKYAISAWLNEWKRYSCQAAIHLLCEHFLWSDSIQSFKSHIRLNLGVENELCVKWSRLGSSDVRDKASSIVILQGDEDPLVLLTLSAE